MIRFIGFVDYIVCFLLIVTVAACMFLLGFALFMFYSVYLDSFKVYEVTQNGSVYVGTTSTVNGGIVITSKNGIETSISSSNGPIVKKSYEPNK